MNQTDFFTLFQQGTGCHIWVRRRRADRWAVEVMVSAGAQTGAPEAASVSRLLLCSCDCKRTCRTSCRGFISWKHSLLRRSAATFASPSLTICEPCKVVCNLYWSDLHRAQISTKLSQILVLVLKTSKGLLLKYCFRKDQSRAWHGGTGLES